MPPVTQARISTVEAAQLRDRIQAGDQTKIIDVRTPAEYESMHISGSYNVPLPLLSEHAGDLAKRLDGDTVLVCQSGARAEEAGNRLAAVGMDTAIILAGGVEAYESAGGDVVRGSQRWAMDRQVRLTAGSLVLAGLLGSKFITPKLAYLSAAIGGGLAYSAISNSCGMAAILAKMPWNQVGEKPTVENSIKAIPVTH